MCVCMCTRVQRLLGVDAAVVLDADLGCDDVLGDDVLVGQDRLDEDHLGKWVTLCQLGLRAGVWA